MVDIVIVNWNSGNYLAKCIQSIFTKINEKLITNVFIIDNDSSDDSLLKLSLHDKLVVVNNSQNNGFSKACNQGFKLCTAPFVLLLNPDTSLNDTTLSDCISFMNAHLEIDILGCQLLNDEGSTTCSCARFPSPIRFFYDATGLSKIAPKLFKPALLMTDWDHKSSRYVDQVMGAFMFMQISIFEKVGYFDERFFVYYEELDFSKRLYELGGKSFFNCYIKAVHSGGGTTNNVKAMRLFLNLHSRLLYSKKHFNLAGYNFVKFCTFFIEPITRNLLLLLKGNFKEIKDIYQGYVLLFKNKA
ncbi:MAG TPA: glycosyltransferase family 2 protein [Ginsengibacter sp.]